MSPLLSRKSPSESGDKNYEKPKTFPASASWCNAGIGCPCKRHFTIVPEIFAINYERCFMPIFNINSTMRTHQSMAYACGIFENPCIPSFMLNWNIQLACPINKNRNLAFNYYPGLTLRRYARLGMMKVRNLTPELAEIVQNERLTEVVLDLLESGWYVLMYINYYYIQNNDKYLKKHYYHSFMVFDHDADAREFKGALYGKRQIYGTVTFPYAQLLEATAPHREGKSRRHGLHKRSILVALQPALSPEVSCQLDFPNIRMQLVHYLNSSILPAALINQPLIRGYCQGDLRVSSNAAFGIKVYDPLRKYFEYRRKTNNTNCDPRITRLLLEHKNLMKVRLLRMMQEGASLDPEFITAWDKVEQLAYGIHLKGVAAQVWHDSSLFISLNEDLDKIKSVEEDFIARLVNRL